MSHPYADISINSHMRYRKTSHEMFIARMPAYNFMSRYNYDTTLRTNKMTHIAILKYSLQL